MIKWEKPALVSLVGAITSQGLCQPTGSSDSATCNIGPSAGGKCDIGANANIDCNSGTTASSYCYTGPDATFKN